MQVEPSSQLLPPGSRFRSPGGRFVYEVLGPVSRLYDREQLPWPSCSLQWRGKQPSWRRIGARYTADLATQRCPSYAVRGIDADGNTWEDVVTIYWEKLTPELRRWWTTKQPQAAAYPALPESALTNLSESNA